MNKYLAILLLVFSGSAFAESYLCIAEAAGGVRSFINSNKMKGSSYDAGGAKWIVTGNNKDWEIKLFGTDFSTYNYSECVAEYDDATLKSIQCRRHLGEEFFVFYPIGGWYTTYHVNFSQETDALDKWIESGFCSKV